MPRSFLVKRPLQQPERDGLCSPKSKKWDCFAATDKGVELPGVIPMGALPHPQPGTYDMVPKAHSHHQREEVGHTRYPFSTWIQRIHDPLYPTIDTSAMRFAKVDKHIQTGFGLGFYHFPIIDPESEPGIPLVNMNRGGYYGVTRSVPAEHGLHLLSDLATNAGTRHAVIGDDAAKAARLQYSLGLKLKEEPMEEALNLSKDAFSSTRASSPKEGTVPSGNDPSNTPSTPTKASIPQILMRRYYAEHPLVDHQPEGAMSHDPIPLNAAKSFQDEFLEMDPAVGPKDKEYACPECGKCYSTSSNLARHRQTHRSVTDQKAKKCPHCEKVYVSMPALSMHIRTHKQNCKCTICGKCFSRPWLLQGHIRTHTGEKPYSCPQCGKAFADKSNLRAHIQTHSSVKPYACEKCNKAFALKSYLYKHTESSCNRVR